jgi:hypothetical protein
MASKAKKPKGFKAFDKLTRLLVQVPRDEAEKQMAKRKIKRRKK